MTRKWTASKRAGVLLGSLVLLVGLSGFSLAEEPTNCGTLYVFYPEDVGFATPEIAVEAASDLDAPAGLSVGVTEMGEDIVTVVQTDAGFVAESVYECDTEIVLAFGAASAHPAVDYVNPFPGGNADVWAGNHPVITYHFTNEVNAVNEAAIARGIETWDAVPMDLKLTQGGDRSNSPVDFNCPNETANEVHYENLGLENAPGAVQVCEGGNGNIVSFEMGIDIRSDWYTGADPAGIPFDKYDMQSVATHEAGHMLGVSHLDEPILVGSFTCPDTDNAATMCLRNGVSFGETFTRTLEFHDKHTITPLYP